MDNIYNANGHFKTIHVLNLDAHISMSGKNRYLNQYLLGMRGSRFESLTYLTSLGFDAAISEISHVPRQIGFVGGE